MIGRLCGTIVHKQAPHLLLDVNGVGYELEATMGTFYGLPAVGGRCSLYTHLIVRDDAHLLYGFADQTERALFRALLKVGGVGARLALTILSGMPVETFTRCVRERDSAALTRLPGVGRKTAERLIVELQDRLGGAAGAGLGAAAPAGAPADAPDAVRDAVSALAALGFKPQEASRMVQGIEVAGKDSEEIIRGALQQVVKRP